MVLENEGKEIEQETRSALVIVILLAVTIMLLLMFSFGVGLSNFNETMLSEIRTFPKGYAISTVVIFIPTILAFINLIIFYKILSYRKIIEENLEDEPKKKNHLAEIVAELRKPTTHKFRKLKRVLIILMSLTLTTLVASHSYVYILIWIF